jgi:hypothetical protein
MTFRGWCQRPGSVGAEAAEGEQRERDRLVR